MRCVSTLATVVLGLGSTACGGAVPDRDRGTQDAAAATASSSDVVDVAPFDSVLARFVRTDGVRYAALAADRGALDRYLAATETAAPGRFSRDAQMAFWINTYNARVLEGVIQRPGLESVLDPGKILGVPTLGFFRQKRLTANDMLSLNDIEHRILRGQFEDPRIHFVLNCASASCPPLPERALTAASLDSVMEAATHAFLADRGKNRIGRDGRLELSAIFKWYKDDFVAASGSVQAFVRDYWPDPAAIGGEMRIRHLPYDWSLNGSWK